MMWIIERVIMTNTRKRMTRPSRPIRQFKRTGPKNGTGPRKNSNSCPINKRKK